MSVCLQLFRSDVLFEWKCFFKEPLAVKTYSVVYECITKAYVVNSMMHS